MEPRERPRSVTAVAWMLCIAGAFVAIAGLLLSLVILDMPRHVLPEDRQAQSAFAAVVVMALLLFTFVPALASVGIAILLFRGNMWGLWLFIIGGPLAGLAMLVLFQDPMSEFLLGKIPCTAAFAPYAFGCFLLSSRRSREFLLKRNASE